MTTVEKEQAPNPQESPPKAAETTAMTRKRSFNSPSPCLVNENASKSWFRFEMLRMSCLIFIACMSIFLKEEDMPTRPLPNQFTQIGTMHHMRKNITNDKNITTLLSAPFYVYKSLIWDNMTFEGRNLSEWLSHTPLKQSEDYWFLQAALKHPMRTFDPEQAQLFVVPALMNFASDGVALTKLAHDKDATASRRTTGACNGPLCNDQLIEHVEMTLANSMYYQRSNGSDHIMVLSNWFSSKQEQILDSPIFRNLNRIRFEDRILWEEPNRITLPSTYVGNPCPLTNKTHDFVLVDNLWRTAHKVKRKRFRARRNVCSWLTPQKYSTGICGSGDQCPALAASRYGFHVRGDTWGANRLVDTLLSGTVAIFTNDQQYAILPDWIDWKLLSVQVNVTSRGDFLQGLDRILNWTNYEEKRNHVLANRDLLDWRTGVPFDVYMFQFQQVLLPETLESGKWFNPYNYSALKI